MEQDGFGLPFPDLGTLLRSGSAYGFLCPRFSSPRRNEASPFGDQPSSTVVRCQSWFYWGLVAHSFFGLSEGDQGRVAGDVK